MTLELQETLLNTLKTRFEKNTNRHQGMVWANVEAKLKTASSIMPLEGFEVY
jgi:hypothetical protein